MVKEGQVVILDSGTTTTAIARALRNFRNLTVVTNAVNMVAELAGTGGEGIFTGGSIRKKSFALIGHLEEASLHKLSADSLIRGVDGFDVRYGLSTTNMLEAKVKRIMLEVSKISVAVCDARKFGRRSLSLIAPPNAIQHVITDQEISKSDLKGLKKAGIDVTLV